MSETNRTAPVSAPLDTQALPPLPAHPSAGKFWHDWSAAEKAVIRQALRQHAAPYAARIAHLERNQLPKLDEDDEVSFVSDAKLAVLHEERYWELRAAEERVAHLERELAERKPVSIEPERMSTDESREYLVKFMEQHFTDKTYHRYIRGERGSVNLAGDFAWQMARALRIIDGYPLGKAGEGRAEELERQVQALLNHCPDPECFTCGAAICPHGEPLHFHHDGCPACAQAEDAALSPQSKQEEAK